MKNINKFKNLVTPESRKFCMKALDLMGKSDDPMHDIHHVSSMLNNLSVWLKSQEGMRIRPYINFDILILSICWHDTWKASKKSPNLLNIIYYQLYEGIGSSKLFKKYAHDLDDEVIDKVSYAIRKHSQFQILPRKTLESKILRDLDLIEMWDHERLKRSKEKFFLHNKFGFVFLKYYLKLKDSRTYFDWGDWLKIKKKKQLDYLLDPNKTD